MADKRTRKRAKNERKQTREILEALNQIVRDVADHSNDFHQRFLIEDCPRSQRMHSICTETVGALRAAFRQFSVIEEVLDEEIRESTGSVGRMFMGKPKTQAAVPTLEVVNE